MTYELCNQLKDAGFPQKGRGYLYGADQKLNLLKHFADEGDVYQPTLSELIEACGESLECLKQYRSGGWACGYYIEGEWEEDTSGSSPEEAVAKLWLELNKK